jgi:hypothetical protein
MGWLLVSKWLERDAFGFSAFAWGALLVQGSCAFQVIHIPGRFVSFFHLPVGFDHPLRE